MNALPTTHEEIDLWFLDYFHEFIAIGTGRSDPKAILAYWGVPVHMSGPAYSRWITSSEDVVRFLTEMQGVLRKAGYSYTEIVDKQITIYSKNASSVETIMSRCRADGTEIDRAAIVFEIRRTETSWIMISTAARPTDLSAVRDVW